VKCSVCACVYVCMCVCVCACGLPVFFLPEMVNKVEYIVTETSNTVAKIGNNVQATFDIVEKIVKLVAFDIVAWTLLLVWFLLLQSCLFIRQCCFDIVAGTDGAIRRCSRDLRFSHLSRTPTCDGRTERHTDRRTDTR